jgi:hypothetical protein
VVGITCRVGRAILGTRYPAGCYRKRPIHPLARSSRGRQDHPVAGSGQGPGR